MSPHAPTNPSEWLVFVYRVPTTPTRLRAMVLRRLHRLGALSLQRSAVALPWTPGNERGLRLAQHEVESMSGTAFLFKGRALGCYEELWALVVGDRVPADAAALRMDHVSGLRS